MLDIILEYRKGILFVRMKGELTKKTIVDFEKKVLLKMKQGGIYHVVYNLEELSLIDGYGYNRILYSYELCMTHKGRIFICGNLDKNDESFLNQHRIKNYVSFLNSELEVFKEVLI